MTGQSALKNILLSASAAILLAACGGGGGDSSTGNGQQASGGLGSGTVVGNPNPDSANPAPDGGPTSSQVTCSIMSECFDLTQSHVTAYKDFKQAAASYTFDDGLPTSPQIADIFEQRGYRATFYINAGLVQEHDWPTWGLLAKKGHEIGNHSWTHAHELGSDSVTDEQLKEQIYKGQQITEDKIGIRPLGFAFPWHSYNQRALNEAYKTHFAVRLREADMGPDYQFAFFDTDISHYPDSDAALKHVNQQLKDAFHSGGWFVAAGHGIDGDGWSPVSSEFLQAHLDLADSLKSQLWVDTHLNVERYRHCRTMVDPEVTIQSGAQVTLSLTGNYNPAFCTEPLTLAIPVLKKPHGTVAAVDADGKEIAVKPYMDKLLINLKPGQTVTMKFGQ